MSEDVKHAAGAGNRSAACGAADIPLVIVSDADATCIWCLSIIG